MKVDTTAALEDIRRVGEDFARIERIGYDGVFSFEAKHDPFVPIAVAGEVADGFIAHPFNSRRSLLQHTLPALERGLARSGRRRSDIEVVCPAMVGPRREIAGKIRARFEGIADGASLTHNRAPDPDHWADVVEELTSH